jgi:serine/threonine protein kinase
MLENKGDLSGRTLGNCTLERLLGQGGMGAVYLARQERPTRYVAVKVLHSNLAMGTHGNEEFQARFQREANVIARLEHVNIMPIYEYGEENGIAYLVMPYVSGGSLKDVLVKRGVLSLQEAMNYIDQAASALDYAHSQGVVHRDLKPANFLLHTDGRLVLADFGIARIIEESVVSGSELTSAGTVLGTPEYMAPEMAGAGVIDYRADIYELGIVLFQMLTGRVPFSGTTPYAVVIKQIQERLPSVLQSNPSLPAGVDGVIQKATAKIPDDRYQTARAMAQALHQSSSTPVGGSYSNPGIGTATGHLSGQPLVLPAVSTYDNPGLIQRGQGAGNTGWNNPAGQTVYGAQPSYPGYQTGQYAPPITEQRRPWMMILALVALLLLVVGGVAFGSQIVKNLQGGQGNTPGGQATVPAAGSTITPAVTPQPTPNLTPTPSPILTPTPTQINAPATIVTGNKLYGTNRPGPGCDRNRGQWTNYNGVRINCLANRTRLANTNQNQGLEGILLSALPGQDTFPTNYVIQARVQQDNNSNGDIGIYFRNQPGQENQGVYTFLIHSDGTWSITVYDNNNATPTELKKGTLGVDPQGQMDLGVIANGQQFDVYVNKNYLGSVIDGTYPTGTVGLFVGAGASMQVTNFALSELAA